MDKQLPTFNGTRLREKRLEKGFKSREALASPTGVSASSIKNAELENVAPSTNTLMRLASALDVDMSYFFEHHGQAIAQASDQSAAL